MKLGELFMELGFKVDNATLESFRNGVTSLRNNMLGLIAVATAALYAVDRFVESSTRGAVALTNFNAQTGLSIVELQKWQAAANGANPALGIDQVAASISRLQENLTNIRLGKGNIEPFSLLGINALGSNAFQVLDQLRDRIKGLDRPLAVNLIQQMGLSPEFINVLELSQKDFDKLSGSFSRSRAMVDQLTRLGQQVNLFRQRMAVAHDELVLKFMPAWEALLKGLYRAADIFASIGRGVSMLYDVISRSKIAIVGLSAAVLGLAIAFAPVSAAIVAFLLLLEDIAVYAEGGKSVFGELVEAFKDLGKWLSKTFDDLTDSPFFTAIKTEVIDPLNAVLDRFDATKGGNGSSVGDDFSPFAFLYSAKAWKALQDELQHNFSAASDNPWVAYGEQRAAQQAPQITNTFILNGYQDPASIARGVSSEMQQQLNRGYDMQNNGAQN